MSRTQIHIIFSSTTKEKIIEYKQECKCGDSWTVFSPCDEAYIKLSRSTSSDVSVGYVLVPQYESLMVRAFCTHKDDDRVWSLASKVNGNRYSFSKGLILRLTLQWLNIWDGDFFNCILKFFDSEYQYSHLYQDMPEYSGSLWQRFCTLCTKGSSHTGHVGKTGDEMWPFLDWTCLHVDDMW